jgi:hypothetical protein
MQVENSIFEFASVRQIQRCGQKCPGLWDIAGISIAVIFMCNCNNSFNYDYLSLFVFQIIKYVLMQQKLIIKQKSNHYTQCVY